ncbi:MAG: efflux RND transporter periplasmic adaptor subunit, partial [Vicinamibacteraceae bacterium]
MTAETRVSIRRPVLIAAGAALVAVGAGAGYAVFAATYVRSAAPVMQAVKAETPTAPAMVGSGAPGGRAVISVRLSKDARERAGIAVTSVAAGADVAGVLRAPGVVEANAYKRVAVTPVAAGRVTRVGVELGEHVKRGRIIAEIFSPELAEVQATYASARAELDAHERELARTEKLVQIGSASRQELERLTAEHAMRRTAVASTAARLRLLGLSDAAIDRLGSTHAAEATVKVAAPLTGVVTERTANVGLNVDAATTLATIVDLSTVWIVADIAETDFGRVHVGTPATITTVAYPTLALTGRVSYIDPQVNPATRTGKVRVEVSNPNQQLRLGMLAEAVFAGGGRNAAAMTIPRRAVQTVAARN